MSFRGVSPIFVFSYMKHVHIVILFKAAAETEGGKKESWSDCRQGSIFCHPCVLMANIPPEDGMQALVGTEIAAVVHKGSWEM